MITILDRIFDESRLIKILSLHGCISRLLLKNDYEMEHGGEWITLKIRGRHFHGFYALYQVRKTRVCDAEKCKMEGSDTIRKSRENRIWDLRGFWGSIFNDTSQKVNAKNPIHISGHLESVGWLSGILCRAAVG